MSLAWCSPFSSHARDSCGLLAEVLRGRFVAALGSPVQKELTQSLAPATPSLCSRDEGVRQREEGDGQKERARGGEMVAGSIMRYDIVNCITAD